MCGFFMWKGEDDKIGCHRKKMKKIIKMFKRTAILAGIFGTMIFTNVVSAAEADKLQYFTEFTIPAEIALDPTYERASIVRWAQFHMMNAPFGVVPAQMYLIGKHENDILMLCISLRGNR